MTLVELFAGVGSASTVIIATATDVIGLITSNPILFVGTLVSIALTGVAVAKKMFR